MSLWKPIIKPLIKKTYQKLYPSSSHPGLYFGSAKIHKLKGSHDINLLPLKPIISNIGTATYEISKYLAGLLAPLATSEYSIKNTKDFISRIKDKRIEEGYKMVSFDVTSLFTNVPLDFVVELIVKKVYDDKLVNTKLNKNQLRQLLFLCTKEMHFSFEGDLYKQINGVAMGSPLGPVLANVFMVELERQLVPSMSDILPLWFRYVDDTFTFIKEDQIDHVLNVLNNFHQDIKFTHEVEEGTISFLDVQACRNTDGTLKTEVFRKSSDTNIYLHWDSFCPKSWKIGTLKGLVRRAHIICSDKTSLDKEIKHLKFVFTKVNGFPSKQVSKSIYQVEVKINKEQNQSTVRENNTEVTNNVTENQEVIFPHITLPYKGKTGEKEVGSFRKYLKNFLPTNIKPRFAYKGKNVGSFFGLKDKIKLEHQSNLVYGYTHGYVGETGVRYGSRKQEHATDKNSSIFKFAKDKNIPVQDSDFHILAKGYKNSKDRKIAEALFIKKLKPSLNEQKYSHKLKLFN